MKTATRSLARSVRKYSFGGTPDIRVILYRGVPIMAMVRLPTTASRGRANLHQGAIAAAIDIRTGKTFGGVYRNRPIENHPDTGAAIQGFQIPFWNTLLLSAMDLADNLGLLVTLVSISSSMKRLARSYSKPTLVLG